MAKTAAELKKEARKKEIEEKRARLKALRAGKKEGAKPVEEPVIDQAKKKREEELNTLKDASNVDDLLDALELPSSARETESEDTVASPLIEPKKSAPLTLQQRLAEFNVSPKVTTTYEKATQTVSLSVGTDSDDENIPLISTVAPTTVEKEITSLDSSPVVGEEPKAVTVPAIPEEDLTATEIQRMLYSQEFAEFLGDASRVSERASLINNKFDILANYKGEKGESENKVGENITLLNTLKDERWTKNRAVTSLHCSPKFPELFLASYSANSSSAQEADGVVLVWTMDNLLEQPEFVFNCQSPVLTAQFPKFQPNIILGGTYSGQIVLWDTRAKSTPVQRSPLSSAGHTHPVYCLDVVGTQNAHNLVSISTDGTLCAWSLSNLSQPIEQINLEVPPLDGRSVKNSSPASTCVCFEEGQVNKFYIGTEEGAVYHGARHGNGKGLTERFRRALVDKKDIPQENTKPADFNFSGHCAPITGMDFHASGRSADLSSFFLTSSLDWSVKLWNKRSPTTPVKTFQYGSSPVYDVKWSVSNPGLFATGDGDGSLHLWDINKDLEVPFLQEKVSQHSIHKLSFTEDPNKILVGDAAGSVYLYDLGDICQTEKESWDSVEETLSDLSRSSIVSN